jgi:hypothetical protein
MLVYHFSNVSFYQFKGESLIFNYDGQRSSSSSSSAAAAAAAAATNNGQDDDDDDDDDNAEEDQEESRDVCAMAHVATCLAWQGEDE